MRRVVIDILLNCKEHLDVILGLLLAYRAAMHVGGLARGWKGVEMWQNCPLAFDMSEIVCWIVPIPLWHLW